MSTNDFFSLFEPSPDPRDQSANDGDTQWDTTEDNDTYAHGEFGGQPTLAVESSLVHFNLWQEAYAHPNLQDGNVLPGSSDNVAPPESSDNVVPPGSSDNVVPSGSLDNVPPESSDNGPEYEVLAENTVSPLDTVLVQHGGSTTPAPSVPSVVVQQSLDLFIIGRLESLAAPNLVLFFMELINVSWNYSFTQPFSRMPTRAACEELIMTTCKRRTRTNPSWYIEEGAYHHSHHVSI